VFANCAWLTLLAMAPRPLAAAMVVLRFNRAEFFRIAGERIAQALAFFGLRPRSRQHHAPAVKGAGLSGRD